MKFTADQAKHANYACAAISLIILTFRLAVSQRRQRPLDLSFLLVLLSVITVVVRIVVVFYYLLYGTASDAIHNADYFNTHDLSKIETGSKLSLVARVLITASCWLQICLLLLFYGQIMSGIRWVTHMIRATWTTTAVTFVAVVFATFLECRPLHLYWQVAPDPGVCVKGYVQLLVQCASNIILDLMLLAISYPILFGKGRSWSQHVRVGGVFILGTFCIIVTTLRLVSVLDTGSAQPTRSLWASVQMVVSTFVANAPTIYGDLKATKRKKNEAILRRMSRPEVWARGDSESNPVLVAPERAATVDSQGSTGSSRKEWFDHLEEVEDGRWNNFNWQRAPPDQIRP